MNTAIYSFIKKHSLINHGDTIIVGLSGGPDSVYLLHTLNQLRDPLSLTLIAVHLNHEWRSDAEDDVIFCKNMCLTLGVTFESTCAKNLIVHQTKKGSLEEQGRMLRRAYFGLMKKKYNANSIALGHHQDDQIETFFIRLIRGASLEGLGSIKPSHNGYIRPLLKTSKTDILAYLAEKDITYRIDSTNDSPIFLRNRLRAALPLLIECDNRFSKNTLKAIDHIQEVNTEIQEIIKNKYSQITFIDSSIHKIKIPLLRSERPFFQKQILVMWLDSEKIHSLSTISNALLDEILRFVVNNRGGMHQIHSTWKIVKKHNNAWIEKF